MRSFKKFIVFGVFSVVLSAVLLLGGCSNSGNSSLPQTPPSSTNNCDNGHTFEKNRCSVCGYEQTDLSEITDAQATEYIRAFTEKILVVTDAEIIDTYYAIIDVELDSYEDYVKKLNDAETQLEKAQNQLEKEKAELEEIKNNKCIQVFNPATNSFEWRADEKAIKQQQDVIDDTQNTINEIQNLTARIQISINSSKALIEQYIAYLPINCYSYGLMIVCNELENKTSNKIVQDKLLALYLKYYKEVSDYDESLIDETWYTQIKNDIASTTGIAISLET